MRLGFATSMGKHASKLVVRGELDIQISFDLACLLPEFFPAAISFIHSVNQTPFQISSALDLSLSLSLPSVSQCDEAGEPRHKRCKAKLGTGRRRRRNCDSSVAKNTVKKKIKYIYTSHRRYFQEFLFVAKVVIIHRKIQPNLAINQETKKKKKLF